MLLFLAAVASGLVLLVWGSDRFVLGASSTARNLGVSPLVIGLTVVGVGTSAPEIFVSAVAAVNGNPGLAVGNAVGSNIANLGLVLGATAVVSSLLVSSNTLWREFPIMFAVIGLAGWILWDGELDRQDGVVLMGVTVVLVCGMVFMGLRARRTDPLGEEFDHEISGTMSVGRATLWLALGLVVLLVGSRVIVWGAVGIARALDVSDLVIGLTVVALGTSLPELAASITSALKGEPDIALGNVMGSNMFNLLPVLSLPGLIAPGPIPPEVVGRDFVLMLCMSGAVYLMAFGLHRSGRIRRWHGLLLLGTYFAYQYALYAAERA